MIKLGLRHRMIFTYLVLVILGVGGLVIRFGLLERERFIEETEHELELKTFILAAALDAPLSNFAEGEISYGNFAQLVTHLSQSVDAHLTLLTLYGEPIYDNRFDFRRVPNQFNQPEVQHALQGAEQHQIRVDPLTGEEYLFAAALVSHDGEGRGVVQLSIPTAPLQAEIGQSWLILVATALIIVAAAVLVSLWLANYILRPLKNIKEAAAQLAGGNLDRRLNVTGTDELSDLAGAFNHMADQLKQMITQQRQFVANASHELRTPLTNIKLRAEALVNGARHDPAVAERFLAEIEHETDRMEYLTRNLLALSRLDANPTPHRPESLDMGPFLTEIINNLAPLAQARQIKLTLNTPPSLRPILASPEQMRQVFDNLLGNALKYTPAGGKVTVAVRAAPQELVIDLADTGPGIPEEDLPHIFERFYRVDKARTRHNDPGGTGLGLSIVEGIIQAHHGKITVASQPGHSATFTLHLPFADAP